MDNFLQLCDRGSLFEALFRWQNTIDCSYKTAIYSSAKTYLKYNHTELSNCTLAQVVINLQAWVVVPGMA